LRNTWFSGSLAPEPPLETVKYCVEALQPFAEQAGLTRKRLDSIVKDALMPLHEEWRGLPKNVPIDGRFVSSIIVDMEA
jgi:hypothetical protein